MLRVDPFLPTTQTGRVAAFFKLGKAVFHGDSPL
jgi:hypothetical protein